MCVLQTQPRKHVLDHADDAALTRQHELDHTDHTDHTDYADQERISLPCLADLDHKGGDPEAGVDFLSEVPKIVTEKKNVPFRARKGFRRFRPRQ